MTRAASTLADLPLFARARSTDPASSHAAAARVQRAGIASAQRREALHLVARWPGHTAGEIAALACPGDDVERERLFRRLGRRLCELRDASPQRVHNGHTHADTRGLRWWIVEAEISDARLDG